MAFFKKKNSTIDVVAELPALDASWFDSYFDAILRDARVPPDDGQNRMQLITFILQQTIDSTIQALLNELRIAPDEYQRLVRSTPPASPAQRAAFLVSKSPSAAWVLVNQLSKHADLAVQAGQMYGRMRFFSSQCCGEPTEFDLQDASAYCSRCHQPVLFNKTT
jgi:hypothetical protein